MTTQKIDKEKLTKFEKHMLRFYEKERAGLMMQRKRTIGNRALLVLERNKKTARLVNPKTYSFRKHKKAFQDIFKRIEKHKAPVLKIKLSNGEWLQIPMGQLTAYCAAYLRGDFDV